MSFASLTSLVEFSEPYSFNNTEDMSISADVDVARGCADEPGESEVVCQA